MHHSKMLFAFVKSHAVVVYGFTCLYIPDNERSILKLVTAQCQRDLDIPQLYLYRTISFPGLNQYLAPQVSVENTESAVLI